MIFFQFNITVDEVCVLLGYYAASGDSSSPMFWDNLWVPSSRVKNLEYNKLQSVKKLHQLFSIFIILSQ